MTTIRLATFEETAGLLVFALIMGLWALVLKGLIDISEKEASIYSAFVVLAGLFYLTAFALLHFQLTEHIEFLLNSLHVTIRIFFASLYFLGVGGVVGVFQTLNEYFQDEIEGAEALRICVCCAGLTALAALVLFYYNLDSHVVLQWMFPAYKI